ncbi:hypothetical protein Tco_0878570, partial [Tanacetum coccineum]
MVIKQLIMGGKSLKVVVLTELSLRKYAHDVIKKDISLSSVLRGLVILIGTKAKKGKKGTRMATQVTLDEHMAWDTRFDMGDKNGIGMGQNGMFAQKLVVVVCSELMKMFKSKWVADRGTANANQASSSMHYASILSCFTSAFALLYHPSRLIRDQGLDAHFYLNDFAFQDPSTNQIFVVGKGSKCLYICKPMLDPTTFFHNLSESDAQQVARFNNGLHYHIQAIISIQTSWTLDEAVRMELKVELTISKGQSNSKFKNKPDLNQSSNQSGEKRQPLNSNEAEKNKSTYASTSSQATKKPINQYAWPVGNKCFKCQKTCHTSNQCRAKAVNITEQGEWYKDESKNEECFIRPEDVHDEEEDDEHEAYSYVVRRLMLTTPKKVKTPGNEYSLKDKNQAKTDKTEHGNEKSVKMSTVKVNSQSQQVKEETEAEGITLFLFLRRFFLKIGRALIDVYVGELTLRVGNKAVTFNLDQTLRYSSNYDDISINRIDIIDVACEEYSQEVLGFSVSGNPTPTSDPIVSTSSPTLTPFGDSDFLLEKTDAFLAIEDETISPEIDDSYYDSEGDILLLEKFINDDPSSPPLPP